MEDVEITLNVIKIYGLSVLGSYCAFIFHMCLHCSWQTFDTMCVLLFDCHQGKGCA